MLRFLPPIAFFLGLFLPVLLLAEGNAVPANPIVNGYVLDAETGETLVGASVRIAGKPIGTATNKSGFFSIANLPPGKYTLTVSFVGYATQTVSVNLAPHETKSLRIQLVPEAVKEKEVVVEGSRFETDRDIPISHINIPVQQISKLRIGGEADVFRSIQYLPGVLASSQVSSGLYIRGGSPDQTLVQIDGSTVYNPTHLFGFFSTFNTDAIKDVDLIKGGYPAEYGGRLSAVLDLVQKDGNRNAIEGIASLGLISSKLSLQGPVGDGSWFLGGRRTYVDALTSLLETAENPLPDYYFYDANAKVSQSLGASDRVFLSGFASTDFMAVEDVGFDGSFGISNMTAAARWTHLFSENVFSVFNASWSRYENEFNANNAGFETRMRNAIRDLTLKGNVEWFVTPALTFKGGFEATHYIFNFEQNFTGSADSSISSGSREAGRFNLEANDNIASGFAQTNWNITEDLSLQTGVRMNWYQLRDIGTVDPRIAARWQLHPDLAVKASWGVFHQYFRLASLQDFSFFDTWLPTDSTVNPSRATHYILGFESQLAEGVTIDIDTYYKSLHNISELSLFTTTGRDVRDFFYEGRGEAYGFEIFVQKKLGRLTGWAGYGLGFINAQFARINEGRWFRPRWDRRHDLKLVGQYVLSDRWDVGATFTFQTGQSYTGMTSRVESGLPGDNVFSPVTAPAERYGLRLPPSHQLNVNASYHTTLFALPFTLHLDVFNVYSRRDIWFRYYDTEGALTVVKDVRLLPILPSVSAELRF